MENKKSKYILCLLFFISVIQSSIQMKDEVDIKMIEEYIDYIVTNSTASNPVWDLNRDSKRYWDYVDGCVLKGILELYTITKDQKYLNFAEYYEDYRLEEDGRIIGYNKNVWNLDNVNPAKNLITLYEITKKKKYRKGAARVYQQVLKHPRTKEGNFWHKEIYKNQVWLDGLYMALPYYMEYEVLYNNSGNINDVYNQFFNVYELMRDKETGLYYHGFDSSKTVYWADKETGLSQNFWLRSLGWYSMSLLDTLIKASDKGSENWNKLKDIFIELIDSMLKYQDESGMWFQVPNFPYRGKNYLETTGTAMYAYSLLKGFKLGILKDNHYKEAGKKAFEGICKKYLRKKDGKLSLGGNCSVAGLGPEDNKKRNGTFDYYMSEKVVENDAKGIGPFILAYIEYKSLLE